jgi:hypothetical protein
VRQDVRHRQIRPPARLMDEETVFLEASQATMPQQELHDDTRILPSFCNCCASRTFPAGSVKLNRLPVSALQGAGSPG